MAGVMNIGALHFARIIALNVRIKPSDEVKRGKYQRHQRPVSLTEKIPTKGRQFTVSFEGETCETNLVFKTLKKCYLIDVK